MTVHVFVDETKERGYLVAAAVVRPENLAAVRQAVRALILPRQRRIHFNGESKPRRHKVLNAIIDLVIYAFVYDATGWPNGKLARDACLTRLVDDLTEMGAARLVLERDDSTVRPDQALLFAQLRRAGYHLKYEHLRAHEECLLSVPDAVAWCWVRGGQWRSRIQEIVKEVRRV